MTSGIYKITNIVNGKFYIGSTVNIKRRWNVHYFDLRKNKHSNVYLQRTYNKYGEKSLAFEILELCIPGDVIVREQMYIDKLKPHYNILKVAGSLLGFRHSDETKQNQSDRMLGNNLHTHVKNRPSKIGADMNNGMRVIQYDLEENMIAEYRSIEYAAKITKFGRRSIRKYCNSNYPFKGYIWKFKNNIQ